MRRRCAFAGRQEDAVLLGSRIGKQAGSALLAAASRAGQCKIQAKYFENCFERMNSGCHPLGTGPCLSQSAHRGAPAECTARGGRQRAQAARPPQAAQLGEQLRGGGPVVWVDRHAAHQQGADVLQGARQRCWEGWGRSSPQCSLVPPLMPPTCGHSSGTRGMRRWPRTGRSPVTICSAREQGRPGQPIRPQACMPRRCQPASACASRAADVWRQLPTSCSNTPKLQCRPVRGGNCKRECTGPTGGCHTRAVARRSGQRKRATLPSARRLQTCRCRQLGCRGTPAAPRGPSCTRGAGRAWTGGCMHGSACAAQQQKRRQAPLRLTRQRCPTAAAARTRSCHPAPAPPAGAGTGG